MTFKSTPSAFKSWRDASYSSYDGGKLLFYCRLDFVSSLFRLCFVFKIWWEANYHLILLSRLCFWVAPRISNLALKRKKLILEKITSLVAGCIQQWHFWGGNQLFTVQSIANNPHIPMAIGERLSWKFCNLDESCSQFILSGFELWAWESLIWFQNIKPGKDVLVITQGIMPTYSDEGSLNISNAKNGHRCIYMLHMLHVAHIWSGFRYVTSIYA